MDYEQSFLANIKSEHETNGDRRCIIGAYLNSFEFTYNALASSSTSFKGNLYFEGDNEARPITFCKLDHRGEEEAKNIFNLTSFINDHRIVRPWFAKLIKQKDILRARGCGRRRGRISNFDNVESFWTIAYDHFDFVLHDGLDKLDRVKDPIHDEGALLWWQSEIKALLCTIRNMHRKKLVHGKLKDMKSYVVVGDEQKMKIINIENKLTRDKEKLQNLKDFKVMLRDLSCRIIGEEANNWNDLTLFLNFFDKGSGYKYDIFVDQLIEHPFLKTPTERED